ncbi:heme ABC transporter ATP-binding protein [Halopiger aswanensis]|uniref:Cobalamin import ATP-binding protein BtuD n=1 Tax=Halopiger aswanensis TaxID=148449 RepID=A0A419WNJ8_9EURY|nr:heme ABC transporter ATP-binding protein [Halopiger aswanensis]RKD97061.1 iron complex transport system ATP-binding protein [Halopiger aswanensis]
MNDDGRTLEADAELATPEPAPITVENVSHAFDDLSVLEDVSLTVEPGEFVGLVGPNGAGKTTLLRTISGALEPDAGTVEIDETDVHDVSSRASSRLVAVVPQDTTLSFSFDVRDVVEMGRHPHRSRFSPPRPEDRAIVEQALERTRTADLADRPIDEISGGQRQRVVLARAIAQATPALVLDEPTASLDINHQVETLELVRELVSEGRTAVAAIHDLDLAARYCDRLVLLADGDVYREGTPSDVLTGDALAESFDARTVVTPNPVTGSETVTALAGGDRNATADGEPTEPPLPDRVHVLGSGRAAAGVLARLETAGVDASIGPVPAGDAAAELARSLAADVLEVDPFAGGSDADISAATDAIREGDVIVFADFVAGTGTAGLLERLPDGTPTVVVETRPFADRNFAGAAAREQYATRRERAVNAAVEDVLEAVRTANADRSDGQSPPQSTSAIDSTDD